MREPEPDPQSSVTTTHKQFSDDEEQKVEDQSDLSDIQIPSEEDNVTDMRRVNVERVANNVVDYDSSSNSHDVPLSARMSHMQTLKS